MGITTLSGIQLASGFAAAIGIAQAGGAGTDAEEIDLGAMIEQLVELIDSWAYGYGWLVAAFVIAFVLGTARYWWLSRKAANTLFLAPISVRGGIAKELGASEAGLILSAELSKIRQVFGADRGDGSIYMAAAVEDSFRSLNTALANAPVTITAPRIKIRQELAVRIGPVNVPIGAIFTLAGEILAAVWTPFRNRYLARRIQVSLVSVEDETQLLVYRVREFKSEATPTADGAAESPEASAGSSADITGVLSRTRKVETLDQLVELLRSAAFDVLELDGKAFPERSGRSMRHFADGLLALDEYRQTGEPKNRERALEAFDRAATVDPDNLAALYFSGSLLAHKRTADAITDAIKAFELAEQGLARESEKLRLAKTGENVIERAQHHSEKLRLAALVHTGLANCHAQRIHRLAKTGENVIERAQHHAALAQALWQKSGDTDPPVWIELTHILVSHAHEGTEATRDDAKRRFLDASLRYHTLVSTHSESGHLQNNLGWTLLKLAQWGVDDLSDLGAVPDQLSGPIHKIIEMYFYRALEHYDANKLVHANLCLLYALPYYRDKNRERYLRRCRYHGLKSLEVHPKYINGHRDLAFSLLRYGETDKQGEARKTFLTALELATDIDKDLELIDGARRLLKELGMPEAEIEDWVDVDPALLVPNVPQPRPKPAPTE